MNRLEGLSEKEVLITLLDHEIKEEEKEKVADRLFERFGTFAHILDAPYSDLSEVQGMTDSSCHFMTLIPEISKRYLQSRWLGKIDLSNSVNASSYVLSYFCSSKNEMFYVICLDSGGNYISSEILAEGTVNEAYIQLRSVVEYVIKFGASSVILAHNHPGGSLKPSKYDIMMTEKIKKCLEPISIKVLDHIIACGKEYYSFAENKLI